MPCLSMYSSPMVALFSLVSVTTPLQTLFMRHKCLCIISTHHVHTVCLSWSEALDLAHLSHGTHIMHHRGIVMKSLFT